MSISGGDKKLSSVFQECLPSMVRNVCVIAHVDHGKTTLADFLVSANGIISARLAGKLRYMDSREDEQTRGITMKSSAVTLYYEPLLMNLIDSPGHVDFGTEVSSAVNLADIAILLVDAVEGVCSQTESLIRQALVRKLDIVLVINKLDRLIVELRMSEAEAHRHLQRLIEYVNACLSKTIQGQLLEEDWGKFERIESQLHFDPCKGNVLFASALHGYAFTLEDFAQLWAKKLAASKQQAETPENNDLIVRLKTKLVQYLFSRDHFFFAKDSQICPGAEQKGKRTLFEQFVLEPLWELHKSALIDKNMDRLRQMTTKLGQPLLKGKRADEAFPELMRQWLPLSTAVVRACARCRSSQQAYQLDDDRLPELFSSKGTLAENSPHTELPGPASSLRQCSPEDPLALVFVAKSFKAADQQQKQLQRRVSLCRVMSGTLHIGDQLFVLKSSSAFPSSSSANGQTHKFDEIANGVQLAADNDNNWSPVRLSGLFLLLGRELLSVQKVPCGRICGIEVDDGESWIGGPLLSSRPLAPMETPQLDVSKFAEPLVRVIIRPANNPGPGEYAELRAALRQLAILDSAVRIVEQRENELVLLTAGEVHLQKCLEDLNALGQTELLVSEPIVPFLETLVPDPRVSHAKIVTEHLTECRLRQFSLRIRLRAVPLGSFEQQDMQKLVDLIQRNAQLIDSFREGILNDSHQHQVNAFRSELTECACESLPRLKGSWWAKRPRGDIQRLFSSGLLAFGPAKAKLNILFNNNALPSDAGDDDSHQQEGGDEKRRRRREDASVWAANLRPLEQAVVGGFHSAMAQGPLCDEPMQGVGIVLEEWTLEETTEQQTLVDDEQRRPGHCEKEEENGQNSEDGRDLVQSSLQLNGQLEENKANDEEGKKEENRQNRIQQQLERLHENSQLHGQLISAIRQTCRAALKKHTGALRLLAAMYECRVQTPEQALGKVQAVLAQKRAKVHSEEVNELSGLFEISAHLPVVESFSFCDQLRKRSSGTASAQLEFTGWQLIDEDPYWAPSTEEEMEEFGRGGVIQNQARQYMDAVRRRKGLPTEDVIVMFAEKQRNLKRNK